MAISITIQPYITEVEVSESKTEVVANLALVDTSSSSGRVEPTGPLTATTLQEAVEQLAAQDFRQSNTPTGSNIEEGDTLYNTDTYPYQSQYKYWYYLVPDSSRYHGRANLGAMRPYGLLRTVPGIRPNT